MIAEVVWLIPVLVVLLTSLSNSSGLLQSLINSIIVGLILTPLWFVVRQMEISLGWRQSGQ